MPSGLIYEVIKELSNWGVTILLQARQRSEIEYII